jgi:flagellar basal body-associated protein FliL
MGRSATTSASAVRTRRQKLLWSPVAIVLVLLMAAGSVVMWVGLPLGLIWLASALTDSSQPSMGPYLLILVGLPVGMFVIGKALGSLDRVHGRITGRIDDRPQRAAWLQSMRDERGPRRKRRSVLDTVMIVSVLLALLAGAVWFLAFAGSPLPG